LAVWEDFLIDSTIFNEKGSANTKARSALQVHSWKILDAIWHDLDRDRFIRDLSIADYLAKLRLGLSWHASDTAYSPKPDTPPAGKVAASSRPDSDIATLRPSGTLNFDFAPQKPAFDAKKPYSYQLITA
jgi:hypothetical protein